MSDYKYGIQLKAEEIAEDKFGKDFYSLTSQQQCDVYTEAESSYFERFIP